MFDELVARKQPEKARNAAGEEQEKHFPTLIVSELS